MDMSSAAFMSYTRFDDEHNGMQLTNFRKLLSGEVRAHTGRRFNIFQDTSDITLGQDWDGEICAGIDGCALFLPIITPSYFTSVSCRRELERFIAREHQLGRNDLILPIYYITCPFLEGTISHDADPLIQVISARNRVDLRDLRGRPPGLLRFRTKFEELAIQVVAGLERTRAMRRQGIFTHDPLPSSVQGTTRLALVTGAHASLKSGIRTVADLTQGADDQVPDLSQLLNRMRQCFAAMEMIAEGRVSQSRPVSRD